MSTTIAKACLPLALLLLAGIAPAQQFRPKTITFAGYSVSREELLKASGLPSSGQFTQTDMQAAAQRLSETGLFENVRFSFDGQELRYELKPASNTLPAAFANFPWWDSKALETALEGRVQLFHGSVAPDSGLQAQIIQALTAMLAEKQIEASVSAIQKVDLAIGRAKAVEFRIDKPAVQVGAISFSGATPQWTEQLAGVVNAEGGRDFEEAETPAELMDAVAHVYRKRGFLDETAGVKRQTPLLDAGKVLVPVEVSITEGEQYHLGGFTLAGSVLVSQEEFDKGAKLKAGDVVDEDKLHATMKSLSRPYISRGYLHAKIAATPALDREKHIADYAISVVPGDVYTMGNLTVRGVDDNLKALVLKTWSMKAGDPFDGNYATNFLTSNKNALHALDGFSGVYKQIEHLDTHVVDLEFTLSKVQQRT